MTALNSPPCARRPATKAQDAHERLKALASQLGPCAKFPTVAQLRRDLQVSITTLDGVLTQLERQNVICRKQGSGIFVSSQVGQKCVGLVCDPAFFRAGKSPFWNRLIEEAQSRASLAGESFRFYLAIPSLDGNCPVHQDLMEDVEAKRIHGVILIGNKPNLLRWLHSNKIPTAVFAGRGKYRVRINTEGSVIAGGKELVRRGCRKLALFVPWEVETEPTEKLYYSPEGRAFRRFVQESGLELRPDWVWETRALGDRVSRVAETRPEQGYQAVREIWAAKSGQPDGIICVDDMMTRGALAGLRKIGVRPGHDVQLVTHINRGSTVLAGEDEHIIFVEVDPAEIVQELFLLLEAGMSGRTPERARVLVNTTLKN